MATDREQAILDAFLAAAGDGWRAGAGVTGLDSLPDAVTENSRQVEAMASASKAQTEVMANYASVLQSSPVYRQATAIKEQDSAAGAVKTVLENALGMVPLARLVVGLFDGGEPEEPAPLIKYALPPRMRFDAANGPGESLTGVDYGQTGLPRAYREEDRGAVQGGQTAVYGGDLRRSSGGFAGGTTPQITIQVQAMDSKSFLDHKEDIARAVREAMLNMHPVNDVVSEL
jgi:hypothetical protein